MPSLEEWSPLWSSPCFVFWSFWADTLQDTKVCRQLISTQIAHSFWDEVKRPSNYLGQVFLLEGLCGGALMCCGNAVIFCGWCVAKIGIPRGSEQFSVFIMKRESSFHWGYCFHYQVVDCRDGNNTTRKWSLKWRCYSHHLVTFWRLILKRKSARMENTSVSDLERFFMEIEEYIFIN